MFGRRTYGVYLNGIAYWRNVPARVWTYAIGGYQVMKKRLSYREKDLLGRGLTKEEAREVTDIAPPHRGIITNGASPRRKLSRDQGINLRLAVTETNGRLSARPCRRKRNRTRKIVVRFIKDAQQAP